MQAVSSAMDSRVTAVATMRTLGFFSSSRAMMRFMPPPVPPRKAWVGAGRPAQQSGAMPGTTVTLSVRNFRQFSRSRATASSLRSMAYTRPRQAARAISTVTLPVPAPTSQTTASSDRASLDRHTARTSLLVMGTDSARRNASSGSPKVTGAGGAG